MGTWNLNGKPGTPKDTVCLKFSGNWIITTKTFQEITLQINDALWTKIVLEILFTENTHWYRKMVYIWPEHDALFLRYLHFFFISIESFHSEICNIAMSVNNMVRYILLVSLESQLVRPNTVVNWWKKSWEMFLLTFGKV